MDLDILKIASDTKNMKKLENFTHSALKKIQCAVITLN